MPEMSNKVIQKIQKLLNLSKNSAATDAEAMSALSMAQKLMASHSIEYSDLDEVQREMKVM